MERQREEALRREREKHDAKVSSLMALNENLNERIKGLEANEKDFLAQIDQIRNEYAQKRVELEEEGKEAQRAMQEQQRTHNAQINEMKLQLSELEDQTRLKYDEVVMSRNEVALLEQTHRQKNEAANDRIRELTAKLAETERDLFSSREACAGKGREVEMLKKELKEKDEQHVC